MKYIQCGYDHMCALPNEQGQTEKCMKQAATTRDITLLITSCRPTVLYNLSTSNNQKLIQVHC